LGTLVVDGNNVIGAVPDGWWRDRPGAVRRLAARLRRLAEHTDDRIVLVLDVPQADLPAGPNDGIEVLYPSRRGRDAADERIVQLLDELAATGPGTSGAADGTGNAAAGTSGAADGTGNAAAGASGAAGGTGDVLSSDSGTDGTGGVANGSGQPASGIGDVEVVTSDRALAADAADRRARVTGARTFLARLTDLGC
jgi:predicted RNA-binding protein with PIN domain